MAAHTNTIPIDTNLKFRDWNWIFRAASRLSGVVHIPGDHKMDTVPQTEIVVANCQKI